MRTAVCVGVLVLVAGCGPDEHHTQLVPESPFGAATPQPPPNNTSYRPANAEVNARVDSLGRNLIAANPQLGLRPTFMPIGAPQPEVFHRGTTEIYITDGMVQACKTEGQLAAVLCSELGKMVSEREALAGPVRQDNIGPPPDVPIGHDNGADQTRAAELGRYDAERRDRKPTPPPDPLTLARIFMTRAHLAPADLDAVAPLLQASATQGTLEKQIVGSNRPGNWTR